MATTFSIDVIKAMGYEWINPSSPITATFQSLNIYHIEGLSLTGDPDYTCYDTGTGIRFCIGNDINEVCSALVNDTWTDTQEHLEEWQNSRNARPPYLAVTIHMKNPVTANTGFWQRYEHNKIHTFNTFQAERKRLQQWEKAILPQFLFSLSAQLSDDQRTVYFRNVTRHVDALTAQGEWVVDFTMTASGNVSLTVGVPRSEIAPSLLAISTRLEKPLPLASTWFQAGIDEVDSFKKFRCFFFVIEKLANAVFKQIVTQRTAANHDLANTRLQHLVPKYHQKITDGKGMKNKPIFYKFLWCTAVLWTHLTDDDIDKMDQLTGLRNDASHGNVTTDEVYPYLDVQKLALKLIR